MLIAARRETRGAVVGARSDRRPRTRGNQARRAFDLQPCKKTAWCWDPSLVLEGGKQRPNKAPTDNTARRAAQRRGRSEPTQTEGDRREQPAGLISPIS